MSRAVALPSGLLARFEAAGYARAEPGVLQPAEPFLDVMGEELRQKMFLTADAAGREMCLRPDFTIPVALAHIASGDPARAGSYFYAGPVFRHGANGGEVAQAGVESFGRADAVAAETDVLRLAIESLATLGVAEPGVRIGDRGLIEAAIEGLDAPVAYRRRLKREIANGGSPETLAARRGKATGGSGLFTALDAAGPESARAVIEDVLSLAGVSAVGGRTPAEIAERFLERAAAESASLSGPVKRAIGELLSIDAPAPVALATLGALAERGELKISEAVAALSARLDAFAAAALPVERMRFSSRFGHKLDYYTGLVFELTSGDTTLAGGGRYDGLLSALGAVARVPGVGFALWLDRFGGDRT